MPTISVIVPIYNVEPYLSNCLDSILGQTFVDFELILVNDGSTDRCGEICEHYAREDNRIKVIHKTNGGVSSARNRGIEIANGEYLAFVDPDDTIEPDMYEILFQTVLKFNADMVVSSYKTIDLVNNLVSISSVWKQADCCINQNMVQSSILPLILLDKSYSLLSSWNKLYRRSMFVSLNLRFDEKIHFGEDERLNIIILSFINNLVCVDQPLYNYFVRKRDSLTRVLKVNLYQDYILQIKKIKIDICTKYNKIDYIEKVKSYYTGVTLAHMQDVVGRSISKTKKCTILSEILRSKEFQDDISNYEVHTVYGKILRLICILKQERLLLGLMRVRLRLQPYLNRID